MICQPKLFDVIDSFSSFNPLPLSLYSNLTKSSPSFSNNFKDLKIVLFSDASSNTYLKEFVVNSLIIKC